MSERETLSHLSLQDALEAALRLIENRSDTTSKEDAEFLRTFLHDNGFAILDLTESDNRCFAKAFAKGEPTFTLRGQDASAPHVINYWLSRNPQLSQERTQEVHDKILKMNDWPTKKRPD